MYILTCTHTYTHPPLLTSYTASPPNSGSRLNRVWKVLPTQKAFCLSCLAELIVSSKTVTKIAIDDGQLCFCLVLDVGDVPEVTSSLCEYNRVISPSLM